VDLISIGLYKDLNEAVTDAVRKLVQENTQILVARKATVETKTVVDGVKPC
jgi:hypothetical protein